MRTSLLIVFHKDLYSKYCFVIACCKYLTLCDDGVESKFVLKSESINVDFPKPVSPILNTRMSNVINFKMV